MSARSQTILNFIPGRRNVRPGRLDATDASRGITPVLILWVTSHKRIRK